MQASCPFCQTPFTRRRRDQKFCSDRCRSRFGQARARAKTPVNSKTSRDKWRRNLELFDRVIVLTELYYKTPVSRRLGLLKGLVEAARSGDTRTRAVLSNPVLVTPRDIHFISILRRHRFPMTIGKLVDLYCRHVWNASGRDVVSGKAAEPPTGEIAVEQQQEARKVA